MRKFISILTFIFLLRYISLLNINIEFLFYPFVYINKYTLSGLNQIIGLDISASLFAKLYVMVISYTILRILIFCNILKVVYYLSYFLKIFSFSQFERMFLTMRLIFGPGETTLCLGQNANKKNLYILLLSNYNCTTLGALSIFYFFVPQYLYLIFISHIIGLLLSILIANILYNDIDESLNISDPYKDQNIFDSLMNGIINGSQIMLNIISILIGMSVIIHIIGNIIDINIHILFKQYILSFITNELFVMSQFDIEKYMVPLLISFTNIGFIGIQAIILKMINVKSDMLIHAFFMSLICNAIKFIILI